MKVTLKLVRYLFAAFYVLIGIQTALALLGVIPAPEFEMSPRNAAFQAALGDTGFIVPLMALCFTAGGVLMFFDRTTPLGIMLLAPFVVVIFFTHLMLDGSAIWGTAHLGLLTLFAWQFRSAFQSLWSDPDIQPRE
jgi:hypothetical protein